MCTRHAWDGGAPGQIDFILASQDWFLRDTQLDQHIYSKTDHRPTIVEVERKYATQRDHEASSIGRQGTIGKKQQKDTCVKRAPKSGTHGHTK